MSKSIILIAAVILLSTTAGEAQINNAKTETVKVYGNCEMCENTIEKAANKKKISKADWNEESKMATITYDSRKTSLDAVLKNIALAGYDNEIFLAPDEAYNSLPACCKYEREKKPMTMTTHPDGNATTSAQNHTNHQHNTLNHAAQETNQLTAVFDRYFEVKDALVKTDGHTASAKANVLLLAINAVKMDKLPMDVHMVWMKVLNGLKEDAEHIHGTKNIAHQRAYFINLSKNMYELIKVSKNETPVYYQHCPMANKGKGANWLSKESDIKNPYYGSKMLTCGNTVETIE